MKNCLIWILGLLVAIFSAIAFSNSREHEVKAKSNCIHKDSVDLSHSIEEITKEVKKISVRIKKSTRKVEESVNKVEEVNGRMEEVAARLKRANDSIEDSSSAMLRDIKEIRQMLKIKG